MTTTALLGSLPAMTPASYGVTDLAERWGVAKPSADEVLKQWEAAPGEGVPTVRRLNRGRVKYVEQSEVHAWEDAEEAAGRGRPGSGRSRGPDRRQRKLRGSSGE
jgi:hypothetical protein